MQRAPDHGAATSSKSGGVTCLTEADETKIDHQSTEAERCIKFGLIPGQNRKRPKKLTLYQLLNVRM